MRVLVGALLLALVSASTASAQATGGAEDNLKQKNITLPPPVTPVANYVPAVRVGNLLFLSLSRLSNFGQISGNCRPEPISSAISVRRARKIRCLKL